MIGWLRRTVREHEAGAIATIAFAFLLAGVSLVAEQGKGEPVGIVLLCISVALFLIPLFWRRLRVLLGAGEPSRQVPAVNIKLDESRDLSMDLRADHPQSRLIEIGIYNPNPDDLKGVHANILMTEGIRVGKCTGAGIITDDGWWSDRPTPEPIGDEEAGESRKDYWGPGGEASTLTLPAGASVLYFKLTISEPGTYRFRAKFWGGDLPAAVTKDGFLVVRSAEPAAEGRDSISESIYWGEKVLATPESVFGSDALKDEYFGWLISAGRSVPDSHFGLVHRRSPSTPDGDLRDAMRQDVSDLYKIRARLATEPASRPLNERLGDLYKQGDAALDECTAVPEGPPDVKLMWRFVGGNPADQRQREQRARDWDRRVSDVLGEAGLAYLPAWRQAGDPPQEPEHDDQSQTNPAGLAEFYKKKLSVLAEITQRANA